jgi:hypothetical protein
MSTISVLPALNGGALLGGAVGLALQGMIA